MERGGHDDEQTCRHSLARLCALRGAAGRCRLDSSGDAVFEGLHSLVVRDSSGDLVIARVAGFADVTDSSGDVDIAGVTGDVEIAADGSGDIRIAGVGGSVAVEQDSSGDVIVTEVLGAVHLPD